MSRKRNCWAGAFAALALAILFTPSLMAEGPTRSSTSLTLVDLDGTKIAMAVEDLRKMPQELEQELICVGRSAGFIGIFDFAGVRLSTILEKAKAAQGANEYKQENMYLVFRGTDGYQIIASWTELMQTTEGKRAMVALDKGAEPLPPLEGKLRLILPGDKYVGRSVKCLETIEIRVADGMVEKPKKEEKPAK